MSTETKLAKTLTPIQVCALALGSIVGWGCFVLPGDVFLPNAGPMGTLIGFAVGAILISFVAMAYSYMIKYAPVAGGEFAWAYIGFGPTASFICGWALIIGYIAIIAINISALSLICRFLMPGVFEFGSLYTLAGWKVYTGEVLIMSIAVIAFGVMNYRGVSAAGKLQVVLAFMLSFGILSLFCGVNVLETAHFSNLTPLFAEGKSPFTCVLIVFAISPFLFVGFDTVPQTAEEFAFNPSKSRNIMLIAIFVGMVLYSLVTLSVGMAIPYPEMLKQMAAEKMAGETAWATAAAAHMAFGKLGSTLLACAVFGAVCTGINGFYVASTRLLLAMARSRILPSWFGEIHPKYRTPHKAVIFTIIIVLMTPYAGRSAVGWTVDMSAVGTAVGYLFTCLSAHRMLSRVSEESARRKRIYCTIGALTAVLCLLLLCIPGSPAAISEAPAWCLIIWVAMGICFYFSSRKVWSQLPENELRRDILGTEDIQVFFKGSKAPEIPAPAD
ncbi:APC family permease [Desulfovibrio sp. Huiquan2017]|uniref:APC family permease n=1 Tax=Desulfovibrio sp. Huiquan2017 TaxID=2816861 RepID=UPI001A9228C8|nr:APC family permease [Desulfovibrio sp. Huiquan2017]